MYETIEDMFINLVNYGILAIEVVGAAMLLVTTLRALIVVFKDKIRSRHILGDGISTALSFLLASEVMNTIVAPGWKDIGMTCAILLMRAGMTVLIQWEHAHEAHGE